MRLVAPAAQRLGRRLLDQPDRLADPAEARELLHPTQEGDDDQADDHHRRAQHDEAPARPVEAGRQGHDPHNREQERPEEGGERVVCPPVLAPEDRGARRHARRGGPQGVHQHGQREGRHRQHRGGQDAQDVADGVGTDAEGEVLLDVKLEAPRHQGRQDAPDAVERGADPGLAEGSGQDQPPARHDGLHARFGPLPPPIPMSAPMSAPPTLRRTNAATRPAVPRLRPRTARARPDRGAQTAARRRRRRSA